MLNPSLILDEIVNMAYHRPRIKRKKVPLNTQVFQCLDTIDQIVSLLGLLDICLENAQSSSPLEERIFLLVDSFMIQVEPCLEQLSRDLRLIHSTLHK